MINKLDYQTFKSKLSTEILQKLNNPSPSDIDYLVDYFSQRGESIILSIPFNIGNIMGMLDYLECQRCGKCCSTIAKELSVENHEIDRIALRLKRNKAKIRKLSYKKSKVLGVEEDGVRFFPMPCPFYITKDLACGVYAARPVSCKIFPFEMPVIVSGFRQQTETVPLIKVSTACPAVKNLLKKVL